MTDLFAQYASEAIPPSVQRKQAEREAAAAKPLSALDLKMREKQRLSRAYRVWKKEWRGGVLAVEPRLRDFLKYLRTVRPAQSDELIAAIRTSWLAQAARDVRLFALELVSRHCDRINRQMGFEALDDPLPPQTSLYFEARAILHAGGRAVISNDPFAVYGHDATKPQRPAPLQGAIKTRAEARAVYSEIIAELHGCEDRDTLDIYLLTIGEELVQFQTELDFLWTGDGDDFLGLDREIKAACARLT